MCQFKAKIIIYHQNIIYCYQNLKLSKMFQFTNKIWKKRQSFTEHYYRLFSIFYETMISVQYFSLVVGTAHYLKQSIKSAPFVGHSVGPQTSWRRERVVTRGGQLKILRPTFNHCLMVVQFTWGGRMGKGVYIYFRWGKGEGYRFSSPLQRD